MTLMLLMMMMMMMIPGSQYRTGRARRGWRTSPLRTSRRSRPCSGSWCGWPPPSSWRTGWSHQGCLCWAWLESFHHFLFQGASAQLRFHGCSGGTNDDSTFLLVFTFTFYFQFSILNARAEPTTAQHSFFTFGCLLVGSKPCFNFPHHLYCYISHARMFGCLTQCQRNILCSTILVKEELTWHSWWWSEV